MQQFQADKYELMPDGQQERQMRRFAGSCRFVFNKALAFYAPLNSFKRLERALRKAQQPMSRKVKFSRNWRKAKARVQRIHARIGNARRDYLHKITTTIRAAATYRRTIGKHKPDSPA